MYFSSYSITLRRNDDDLSSLHVGPRWMPCSKEQEMIFNEADVGCLRSRVRCIGGWYGSGGVNGGRWHNLGWNALTLNRRMLLGVESRRACNLLSPPAATMSMSVDIWTSLNIIVRKNISTCMRNYIRCFFYKPDRHDIYRHRYYTNVYESAIHTWWLLVTLHFPPVRPANQGCNLIRVWTSERLYTEIVRFEDFMVRLRSFCGGEALEDGTPLAFNLLHLWTLDVWKNPSSKHTAKFADLFVCGEGCRELHQQQGGAALWIYRRVQGLFGLDDWTPWMLMIVQLIRREVGRWKFQCKELWNDESCGSGDVSHYRWIFGYFWVFWTFEDGKMVEQLVPRNSETASFATRWRANLVFGVVVGRDLTMSRWSETLNGPMPKGQHVLW